MVTDQRKVGVGMAVTRKLGRKYCTLIVTLSNYESWEAARFKSLGNATVAASAMASMYPADATLTLFDLRGRTAGSWGGVRGD